MYCNLVVDEVSIYCDEPYNGHRVLGGRLLASHQFKPFDILHPSVSFFEC